MWLQGLATRIALQEIPLPPGSPGWAANSQDVALILEFHTGWGHRDPIYMAAPPPLIDRGGAPCSCLNYSSVCTVFSWLSSPYMASNPKPYKLMKQLA